MLHNITNKHKVFLIISVILIIALLVGLTSCSSFGGTLDDERRRQYEIEITPLLMERSKLNQQYSHMEQTVKEEMNEELEAKLQHIPNSNITLVFLGAEKELYTEAYFKIAELSELVKGTLCLTADSFPGNDGCINLDELHTMVDNGWSYAILFEGQGADDFSSFVATMREKLSALDLSMPETIVCRQGSYSPSLDDAIISEGFKHVVHNAEEQTALIDKTVEGELFHPGAVAWRAADMQRYFMSELMTYGGCACFTLEFDADSAEIMLDFDDDYIADKFESMIVAIDGWVKDEYVTARDVGYGLENRKMYLDIFSIVVRIVDERRAVIQTRIDEIERELDEIYKRYNQDA